MTEKKRFDGKVAIVIGGASGIGYAIVERLLKEGSKVVIADLNGTSLIIDGAWATSVYPDLSKFFSNKKGR